MQLRHRWSWALVLLLGCASAPTASESPVPSSRPLASSGSSSATASPPAAPSPAPSAATASDPIETRARALVARATALEPSVTPDLKDLAQAVDGEMVKLEYRLKTASSTARKLRLERAADPGLELSTFTIGDSLRYTMVIKDEPGGHYVSAVHDTLVALEAKGHVVVKVKNYWPRDDNYSGINSVLRAPEGLPWELQFHTPASLQVQADTRGQYEELRAQETPLERKRVIFDAMSKAWNEVPLPKGILVPEALHQNEQIKTRPRP